MKKKITASILLCLVVCVFVFTESAFAVNYDQKIKETEEEQKALEKKADQLQKDMEEIEESRKDTMLYIEKLDKKAGELEEELEILQKKREKAEKDLEKICGALNEVRAQEEKQYNTMKKRIRYMYENGNQEYLEMLFGAKSIPDLLNRSEYVQKITDYDQNIFEEYRKVTLEIKKKQQEREKKVQEMESLESRIKEEEKTVKELKADKKEQLEKYDKKIKDSQDKISEYTRKAIAAENEVEKLLKQKQDEIDREIKRKEEKLANLKAEILLQIESWDNEDYKNVIVMRYLKRWGWSKVAKQCFCSIASIYRWHDAALELIVVPSKNDS